MSKEIGYGEEFVRLLECISEICSSIAPEIGGKTKGERDLESLVRDLAYTSICEHYRISREDLENRFHEIRLVARPPYARVVVTPKFESRARKQYSIDLRGEGEYISPFKQLVVSMHAKRKLDGTQKINFLKRISETEEFWHKYRFRPLILLTRAQTKENGFSLRGVRNLEKFFQDFLKTNDKWGYELDLWRGYGHLPSILDTEAHVEASSKGESKILLRSTFISVSSSKIPEDERRTLVSLVGDISKAFVEA